MQKEAAGLHAFSFFLFLLLENMFLVFNYIVLQYKSVQSFTLPIKFENNKS